MTPVRKLRELLSGHEVILGAGAPDALTARLVEQAGFPLCLLGGAALSMTNGYPDLGLLTLPEVCHATRSITDAITIPLIVDADTGFGSVINVRRTVRSLERAGAAGLHIEDQTWPKRAGHMHGKSVIPTEEMVYKIRAATAARSDPDFVIVVRCDALAVQGLAATMERGEAYLGAGADVLFFETQDSVEEVRALGERFGARVPLLYNHSESGRVPRLPAYELGKFGYRIIGFYGHAHLAACKAARDVLITILATQNSIETWERMLPLDEFWEICDLASILNFQGRYGRPPSTD